MNEQDIFQFNERVSRYLDISIIVIIAMLIVFLILLIVCLKIGAIKDTSVRIAFAAFALLILFAYLITALPYQLDMREKAYVEYSGEFYVESYFSTKSGMYITIKRPEDKKIIRYRAPGNLTEIEDDTSYTGSFIFSKRSKVLVAINAS